MFEDIINSFSNFTSILRTFQIKDLIDIAFVAFVIYSAVNLIRETRAGQLIKGIFILLLFYFFAFIFDLSMILSLLKTLFEFGVLAIIVLFQPEIRKALEQIGKSKFMRRFFKPSSKNITSEDIKKVQDMIMAVVDTATIFHHTKTGALIVFERETNLDTIVEKHGEGTVIDVMHPSAAIFSNLFYNKAPLHDGAVIIRNARIYKAGCILPLSEAQNIDISLGTRHRAGLGISEHSDAIAVIVSEETGAISTAMGGKLKRDHTAKTLRELLEKELLPKQDDSDTTSEKNLFSFIKRGDRNEK